MKNFNALSRLSILSKQLSFNNTNSSIARGDIGLIGLAVMGQNLILNMADHGYTVAYNRTTAKVDRFLENEAKGKSILGAHSIKELVDQLKRPRRIMLLVKAGAPVDEFINQLLPYLEEGDIIIDGGNSHFPDSNRRYEELAKKGILFVGSGVSGGEEGARTGPSLMPGGNEKLGHTLKTSSKMLPPRVMVNHVVTGLVMPVLVITSRWSTMVLNMVICN